MSRTLPRKLKRRIRDLLVRVAREKHHAAREAMLQQASRMKKRAHQGAQDDAHA